MLKSSSDDEVQSKNQFDVDQFGHPRVPYRGHYDAQHCNDRRAWAERFGSCSLEHCGQWWLNEGANESCSCISLKGNIENPIGLTKVPLGVCGPLLIKGQHAKGYILCPFATTEGALVASITRGATALTRSGGVHAKVIGQMQIRSPYFQLRSMAEVDIFLQWIVSNSDTLKEKVHSFSRHAELKKLDFSRFGRMIIIHFNYTTGDAAGQNMVTSCTSHLCKWIRSKIDRDIPHIKITFFYIESTSSGDKSMAYINLLRTRGFHVQAEAWIPESVLKKVLKVDPATLLSCYEVLKDFNIASGGIGFNINLSNLMTGVFIATGQDVASIESSHAQVFLSPLSSAELEIQGCKDCDLSTSNACAGVYASITIPSLNVGTVGGGTGLATQKECLDLIGCSGKDNAARFCEIIAGYSLSLELSTMSAIASGQFASAHEKLGRNHPVGGFKVDHLNKEFFSAVVGSRNKFLDAVPFKVNTGNSILSEITKTEVSKKVGHFGFLVTYYSERGSNERIKVVIKSKTTTLETCNMLSKMAQACGLNLAIQYEKYKLKTGFNHCDIREVKIYQTDDMILRKFFPKVYRTVLQPNKDTFVIVMDYLTSEKYTHLDAVNDVGEWSMDDIKVVLHDLAYFHSLYLGRTSKFESCEWLEKRMKNDESEMAPLWSELLRHAHYEFPSMWTKERVKIMEKAIKHMDQINTALASAPLTLIHNDCNPRNMCLRKKSNDLKSTSESLEPQLCLYDWELAKVDVPQRDLAEFLTFTLSPSTPNVTRIELIDYYRCNLQQLSGKDYPMNRFIKIFNITLYDFAIRRLLMYTMAHTFKDYVYLPRVVHSLFVYIEAVDDECILIPSKL